jgi:hypothetical protein
VQALQLAAGGSGALAATGLFVGGWALGGGVLLLLGFLLLMVGRARRAD